MKLTPAQLRIRTLMIEGAQHTQSAIDLFQMQDANVNRERLCAVQRELGIANAKMLLAISVLAGNEEPRRG